MTLLQKIKLSGRYGKGIYIISGIMTLAATGLVCFYPSLLFECIILKLFSIPVLLYLFTLLQKGHTKYFYLNLGISRIEYYTVPLTVEFIIFVICMIISSSIGHAIG